MKKQLHLLPFMVSWLANAPACGQGNLTYPIHLLDENGLAVENHAVVARAGCEAVEMFIAKIDCNFDSPLATAVAVIIRDTILIVP